MQTTMMSSDTATSQESLDPRKVVIDFQVDVLRLRNMLVALKVAAREDERSTGKAKLYWPDLLEALEMLVPDDDVLDVVLDELARASQAAPRVAGGARDRRKAMAENHAIS